MPALKPFTKTETLQILEAGIKIIERDGWYSGAMHVISIDDCERKLEGLECYCTPEQCKRWHRSKTISLRHADIDKASHCVLGAFEVAAVELGLLDPHKQRVNSEQTIENRLGKDYKAAVLETTGCDTLFKYNDGSSKAQVTKAVQEIHTILEGS